MSILKLITDLKRPERPIFPQALMSPQATEEFRLLGGLMPDATGADNTLPSLSISLFFTAHISTASNTEDLHLKMVAHLLFGWSDARPVATYKLEPADLRPGTSWYQYAAAAEHGYGVDTHRLTLGENRLAEINLATTQQRDMPVGARCFQHTPEAVASDKKDRD